MVRIRQKRLALGATFGPDFKAESSTYLRDTPPGRWFGKCWYIHDLLKYEFDIEFDIPITYPTTAPEIAVPELDGKTAKMYRGGKICLTDHFKPLWARNVPKFGLAHLMALGLGPWLAVEIPDLIQKGVIQHKEKCN
ncbi:ubiquitin-fold modifier-conjugating enzyme 1 isoform X2 [Pteronotus mesoamericanus]|uniref:ubiquitin-fold modifier-conjugating enzyme 1 isoform X2 n=1 Tax=Pteronotus mesoamericanus TaxID=1884717 RepID=UPI0023EBA934|nr:ubiquitin-fold modifier-conjugating enzyme 1 isoform X2 [Pteronotus parnellii mesoamericanus]